MKKEHPDSKLEQIRLAMPKKGSQASVILNGVGNGMMIGTIPFVGLELFSHIAEKKIPKAAYVANAFATVGGCAIGGWCGLREAQRLGDYRQSLVEQVERLEKKCQRLDSWVDKTQAQETSAEKTR